MHKFVDEIKLSSNLTKNGNGILVADEVTIARDGVQVYAGYELPSAIADELGNPETISVYRTIDALAEHLSDFEGLPFTDGHTWQPVTIKDTGPICGLVNSARKAKRTIKARLSVFDHACIFDIENGDKREVSLGYSSELTVETGVHDGTPYQVVQTDIRPNHVALTRRGRCGPECAIHDAASCECEGCRTDPHQLPINEDTTMNTPAAVKLEPVVINDSVINVDPADSLKLMAVKTALADSLADVERLKGENATITAECDKLKTDFSDENVAKMVDAAAGVRAAITEKAIGFLAADALKGKTNREIKVAVLDSAGHKNLDSQSDGFIDGAFAALPAKTQQNDTSNGQLFANQMPAHLSDANPDKAFADAREKYMNGGAAK